MWRREFGSAFAILGLLGGLLIVMDVFEGARGEEFLTENGTWRSQILFAAVMLALTLLFAASDVSAFIYFRF